MAEKPKPEFLERVKKEMQKRFTESKKYVDSKSDDWDESWDLYNNEIPAREHEHEANLLIPKPHYIVETITPQVMNTLFGMTNFLTFKDPQLPDDVLREQEKWFMWFLRRKMKIYLRML